MTSTTHRRVLNVIEHELATVRRLDDDRTWRGPTAERVQRDVRRIGYLLDRVAEITLDVENRRLIELRR